MKDIIELARQAGFAVHAAPSINQKIQAFAALVRNAALEEAAVVCDDKIAYAKKRKTDLANGGWKKLAYTLQQIIDATEDTAEKIRALKESGK